MPRQGRPFDAAPFAQRMGWEGDGRDCGLRWEDARDVFRVGVRFIDAVPPPGSVWLEYWQSSWPQQRIARDRASGSGSSGWLNVGDWFQGRWQRADTRLRAAGRRLTCTFLPLNAREFPELGDFPARYRSTLKLRLVGRRPLPPVASLEAYTDSVWRRMELEIEWGGRADRRVWDGRLEAFNGTVLRVRPLTSDTTAVGSSGNLLGGWRSRPAGRTSGVAATVFYAETRACNGLDETLLTVRTVPEDNTFSFSAADLARYGRIFLPDFGVLVRKAPRRVGYARAERAWQRARGNPERMDLYSRVSHVPEQTLGRAWSDVPAKGRHYIPLGFEGGSQHFGVNEKGDAWSRRGLRYGFGLPRSPLAGRELLDGCLPIVVGRWSKGGVRYRQTAFVVPLRGVPAPGRRIAAEEPLVLMVRIEMEHVRPGAAEGRLRLSVRDEAGPRKLALDGDLVIEASDDGLAPLARVGFKGKAARRALSVRGGRIHCRADLSGGRGRCTLDLAIPYAAASGRRFAERLRALRFDEALRAVRDYWRARVAAGTQISTPEPMINDFYKAHACHLLINTERERGGGDRYMARVGTFHYGVFPNESCMMIAELDRRGYQRLAQRALESWLHYQGTVSMPGDFASRRGQLYGAGGYEMGGYNHSHGWILWCLAEHYWYTRDAAWLRRVAPRIVEACRWVARERRRMTRLADACELRAIERGLLPPGNLEDIRDWRCWLATNVSTWWGLHHVARALEAVGHRAGPRLRQAADDYRADLLAACTEAMRRSPVVRLRDGSWGPHVPSDLHRRGRSFGWLTETLEGALHLVICEAIDPTGRLADWILMDYEDNLYLSEQYGYRLRGRAFERLWFSHGGISQQANLLGGPQAYLHRDQPEHFLRAYFNAFAVSYFPDTRMMTEHALPRIGDWRGDHYKTSDEANSAYWLRLMFVQERGEELWLAAAVPRYWLADGQRIGIRGARTHFGAVSMEMVSAAGRGQIRMTLDPPLRNRPQRIRARFRHPQRLPMTRCRVNGKPYPHFDPEREWVELAAPRGRTTITAFYDAP